MDKFTEKPGHYSEQTMLKFDGHTVNNIMIQNCQI